MTIRSHALRCLASPSEVWSRLPLRWRLALALGSGCWPPTGRRSLSSLALALGSGRWEIPPRATKRESSAALLKLKRQSKAPTRFRSSPKICRRRPTQTINGEAARLRFLKRLDIMPDAETMLATIAKLNAQRGAA